MPKRVAFVYTLARISQRNAVNRGACIAALRYGCVRACVCVCVCACVRMWGRCLAWVCID